MAGDTTLIGRFLEADRTFGEISELVEDAVTAAVNLDAAQYLFIRDCTAEWAVYEIEGGDNAGCYRVTFTIDDASKVTLGTPEKVAPQTTYTAVTESARLPGRVLEARGADEAGGRIFRVQIIAYGDSKNGRRYPESVMRGAVRKYEGAKAYDHHRTDDELRTSTITGLVGSYRNCEATGKGIEGDLCLLPSATHTAEALDASLTAQSQGLPPLVGISHDAMARYRPLLEGGRRFMEATEILTVNSADVVADPAAGGQATRMVAGGIGDSHNNNDQEVDDMTLKQLLELLRGATAERRAELLKEHAGVLEENGITAEQATTLAAPPASPDGGEEPGKEKELVGAGVGGSGGTGEQATESQYAKASAMGRMLVRTTVTDAGLDVRLAESILDGLPDRFTEGDVARQLGIVQRVTEGLERAGLTPSVPHVNVTKDGLDKKIERLDAFFAGDHQKGYASFKEAFVDITGRPPRYDSLSEDFNRVVLKESIGVEQFDSSLRSTESVDSSSWSSILGDSITRRMVAEYQQPSLNTWRKLVSSTPPINDFRTQRIDRMGGYGVLPAVNQGAPYQPLTTPTNEEVTYSVTKRGGTEDITLETIANDDVRAIQRVPTKLGLAAAQTLYRFVFDFFPTNPTIYDSVALFHATHSNTATGALGQSTLSAARKAMRKQAAYGDTSDVLSIVPKYLLVPSDLEEIAFQLATSAVAIPATPAGPTNTPNIHQGLEPIVVDYWTDTNDWFVVGDPAMAPTIEVGFYRGNQDPELFVQNDPTSGAVFAADKVTYKIRHIYSGAVLDFRPFQRTTN